VIWEPFVLALVLGIIVSAGLYFAYLWPSIEPADPADPADPIETDEPGASHTPGSGPSGAGPANPGPS
jgi:hypothetical protein